MACEEEEESAQPGTSSSTTTQAGDEPSTKKEDDRFQCNTERFLDLFEQLAQKQSVCFNFNFLIRLHFFDLFYIHMEKIIKSLSFEETVLNFSS